MKASEFRKLIREEVRRALKEATPKFKVGDSVVVDNLEDYPFKVKAIFPNKAKMLKDVQNMTTPTKFKKLVQYLKDSEDDNWDIDDPDGSPWVYVVATGTSSEDRRYNEFPFVVPSEIVYPEDVDEGFRKGLKEAGSPQEQAIKLAVQTALDAGDDDELYNDSSPTSYKKLAKKAGLSVAELEHIVMYCLDAAGEDVPAMDNLDAKAAGGGGLTGYQMMTSVKKKLKGMGIDINKLS